MCVCCRTRSPGCGLRQVGMRYGRAARAQRCSRLRAPTAPPARLLTSQPAPPRMHGREKSPSPPQVLLSTPPSRPPPSQGKAKMYQTFGLEEQWSAPRLLPGHPCPSALLLTGVDGAFPDSHGWWFDLSNALGPSTVRSAP